MTTFDVAILGGLGGHPASNSEFAHPMDRARAEVIGADVIPFNVPGTIPLPSSTIMHMVRCLKYPIPEYDIYVPGYSRMMYALPLVKALYPDSDIVHFATDIFLYGMDIYEEFEGLYGYKRYFDRKLDIALQRKLAHRYVDGVIAESKFGVDFTRAFLRKNIPFRIASSYVQPEVFERLYRTTPNLSSKNAVFVGQRFNGCKGVDLMLEAWSIVREHFPEAELAVVGPGHPENYEESQGVEFTGVVAHEKIPDLLARKSLYIHPARADNFPVSVLEAMLAGLPAVVTKTTGTYSAVKKVDESMVVKPDPSNIADQITDYFSKDIGKREELSRRSKQLAEEYNADTKRAEFKDAFVSIVEEIQ